MSLWRHSDFLKLWTGQTISEIGSRITRDGIPLTAVMVLGASPAQMGLLTFAGAAASIAVGIPAGVWVDRVKRRPVLIATDLARAAVLAVVPVAAFMGLLTMPVLLGVAAAAGVLTVFFDAAYQAYLPALVGREALLEGNQKLKMSAATAEFVGPALTGILVQLFTAPRAILLDAVSFVVSAISVGLIRAPETRREPAADAHAVREARDGLRAISHQPVLRALSIRNAIFGLSVGFLVPLYTLYAIRELGLTPMALGITIAIGGVGQWIGSLAVPALVRRFGVGPSAVIASFVAAAGIALIPAARGPFWGITLLIGSQLVCDSSIIVYSVCDVTMRQKLTADELLGRVAAGMNILERGTMPIGALIGGALASATDVRTALWTGTAGTLVSAIVLALSPVARHRE